MTPVARTSGRRRSPGLAAGALVLFAGLAAAGTPYRGWQRGEAPRLAVDDAIEEAALPNGAVVRFRRDKAGHRYFLGEVTPGTLNLGAVGPSPQEKVYREMAAHGRYEAAAELLDRLLADPANGQRIVVPSWAPWETPGWTSVQALARARLVGLPPAGREAWRQIRNDEANPRLLAAEAAADELELSRLLARYPVATGSARATVALGDLAFERGDFHAAIEAWERACHEHAGEVDAAPLEEKIARARLLARARSRPDAPATPRPAAAAELGEVSLAGAHPLRLVWRRKVNVEPPRLATPLPGLLACAESDAVFVHDARGVLALEPATGRLIWRAELEPEAPWPGDDAPASVAAGDVVAVARGRRVVLVLDRLTGFPLTRIDIGDVLSAAVDDHVDAVACAAGRVILAVALGSERVVAAFDHSGTLAYKASLWSQGGLDASLVADADATFVAADGGIAALDHAGNVRWLGNARPSNAGRSPERGLERAGARLARLELRGYELFDRVTGTTVAAAAGDVPGDALVLGTSDDGPVLLEPVPATPNDSRPGLLCPHGARLTPLRRVEFEDRPTWPGVVARGVLSLVTERDLVQIDLASGRELGRVRVPGGPGRVSSNGEVVVVAREDEVLAFAERPAQGPRAPLPERASDLVAWLGSRDWRERTAARERLAATARHSIPALREALADTRASVEVRESAREILDTVVVRVAWEAALPSSTPEVLSRLTAPRGTVRLRALLGLSVFPSASPEALATAFRRVATHDAEPAVRTEALAQLLRIDPAARKAVFAVLAAKDDGSGAPDLDRARLAAARAVAGSSLADPRAPGHAELVAFLASAPDAVRAVVFKAFLRAGYKAQALVFNRAQPATGAPGDPVAKKTLAAWIAHQVHEDPDVLDDDSIESSLRRAERDRDRRALLARSELEPLFEERDP